MKKKRQKEKVSPYVNINWKKAAILFQRSSVATKGESSKYPKVKDTLLALAKVGSIGLAFAFPGAVAEISSLIFGENSSYSSWRTQKTLRQLEKQKYVSIRDNPNGTITVKITKKGYTRALTYELDTMTLKKPKSWDGKWRVVIFDIPNKYKKVRDIFRTRLKQLGLYQLQESVYITPYKCFGEIEFLREIYGVVFTVQYLLVEKVEDDSFLKEHFNLI